jgi:2-methylcitrate dehydratase PrpD
LRLGDIPPDALAQARRTTLDLVGTTLGGLSTRSARIASDLSAAHPLAALGATGAQDPPAAAATAFALGVAASALDYDDGHYLGGAIHPGAVVVPALLTAAIGRDAGLDDLVVAQVAGYEVGLRLAHLLLPRREGDRWYCTGTAGAVAAAVAAARLRGGDADTIARALEIAWCHAPMAALQFPMAKEAIGWAAATATWAVRLAEAGFKELPPGAPPPAMPDVFPATPFDEPGALEHPFVRTIGERYESGATYLKPFACCRYTHTAAQSLRELLAEGLDPADVAAVEVGTHRGAVFLAERRPPSLEHAQYSYPFVLGAVAAHGDAGPGQIAEGRLGDPAILAFADRVTVVHDPAMDAHFPGRYGTTLRVRLASGDEHVRTRTVAPGDPDAPLTAEQLEAKFTRLAAPVLGAGRADALHAVLARPAGRGVDEVLAAMAGARHDPEA